MIIGFGGKEYVSGESYAVEDIIAAYKQGLGNGKWEAERGNMDDSYYESGYRAATEKFKKHIITLEEECDKQYVKGKTDGYNEGYQHGFILAKEKITELDKGELESQYQRGLKEGKYLERLDSLNSRQHHYHLGYDDALTRMASEEAESNLELKKQGYEEGYGGGFEDGFNTAIKEMSNSQALGETTEYKFGTEDCCEHHNPNKETQEAMQEVLDNPFVIKPSDLFKRKYFKEDDKHKYPHYFKDVSDLKWLDVYQVCKLFPVEDDSGAISHARKKLLVCGGRGGGKDKIKDIKEARDTLNRYLEIEGHLDD
ncbi:Hypothetical protein DAL_34 [Psychrobacter phage D'Alembert]|nr:Hypothetical protein DAL_34 [Psychrobacter phage D'Alembert]